MYVMLGTHPDIAYAVGMLSQYSANPGTDHLNAVNCVLKYCHTQHWRGSGCGKVQSDTQAELAYDGVEGSTYVIGAQTATVSRMLAQT